MIVRNKCFIGSKQAWLAVACCDVCAEPILVVTWASRNLQCAYVRCNRNIAHYFGNNERTDGWNLLSFGVSYDFVALEIFHKKNQFFGNYLQGIRRPHFFPIFWYPPPPCHFFTSIHLHILRNFDPSHLQIVNIFYEPINFCLNIYWIFAVNPVAFSFKVEIV